MQSPQLTFTGILGLQQRILIYLISFVSTIFLTFYAQLICPFLEMLPFFEMLRNLLLIFVFQIILRETVLRVTKASRGTRSIGRQFYRTMTMSWLLSGLVAMGLHEFLYNGLRPDLFVGAPGMAQAIFGANPWPSYYPWHSHLKVLSAYWFLGAGLLTQLELTVAERYIRRYIRDNTDKGFFFHEKISSRITWGNFFYAFVPSVAVLIMVIRYAFQDMIIPLGVTLEIAYIGIIFTATAVWAAVVYGRMLRDDTREIVDALGKVGAGDFGVALIPTRQDELGQVAGGINKMAEGLMQRERIRESFGHFVSPEIADRFIHQYSSGKDMRGGGDRKNVAVLMCDIRNFSSMSDTMDPSDITRMLNNYFDFMVRDIEENGGIVDKFIGDAVMAVFGLLGDSENPTLQAVNTAVAIRRSLKEANTQNQTEGLPQLENGIGIHYGEVIASFLGSSKRLEFTVIGSTVNVAARLESQAKPPKPPIILSLAAAKHVKDHYTILRGSTIELKGVGKQHLFSVKIPEGREAE